jgi:hypothetical protein
VTLNGPHPTLTLPLIAEVWKWDWMSDVSPSISRTTFTAGRKAENETKGQERRSDVDGWECGYFY